MKLIIDIEGQSSTIEMDDNKTAVLIEVANISVSKA
jgi:hypothetical protein